VEAYILWMIFGVFLLLWLLGTVRLGGYARILSGIAAMIQWIRPS